MTSTNGKTLAGVLDLDQITELLGKGRTRGGYEAKLGEFVESDEPAINVAETWSIEFGKKPASTLYQGFNNVLNKNNLKDTIEVKRDGTNVYLLHKDRVQLLREKLAAGSAAK